MSVIFIGSIYPPGSIEKLKISGSIIDYASETFETSLLQGLCEYYPQLKVITAPTISTYPKIQEKKFDGYEFELPYSKEKHCFTGFSNISYKKMFTKILRTQRAIEDALDEGNDNIIIVYAVHSPFLLALCGINRRKYKSCLVVPDLPEFMSDNSKLFYRFAKKIDGFFIRYALRCIDSFVLFSPHMQERLPIKKKPWVHMEGIYNSQIELNEKVEKAREKVILYTGNLQRRMGISKLLEAFSLIPDPEYRLWIRGDGANLNEVRQAAEIDPRILYIEPLSKVELLRLLKKATVLINPVFSSQKFTRYFFPSKTMEYMASGTPTIMSKLACIPQEYYPFLYFFDEESVEGIKNKIVEVCEKPSVELEAFGKAASNFILKEKTEIKQSEKIVDIINQLIKRK